MYALMNKLVLLIYLFSFLFPVENVNNAKVIDGDTIIANGEKIRLIGINAPEKGERCYRESKEFLKKLIKGEIQMQRDIVNKDKYGRKLRYIFVNGTFIEEEMVKNGYAKAFCIFPNIRYCEYFKNLEAKAVNEKRGCLYSNTSECVKIVNISKEGDWIYVVNKCDQAVNVTIENSGRDKIEFTMKGGEIKDALIRIFENDAVYVFTNSMLSDYRRV